MLGWTVFSVETEHPVQLPPWIHNTGGLPAAAFSNAETISGRSVSDAPMAIPVPAQIFKNCLLVIVMRYSPLSQLIWKILILAYRKKLVWIIITSFFLIEFRSIIFLNTEYRLTNESLNKWVMGRGYSQQRRVKSFWSREDITKEGYGSCWNR